MWQKSASIWYDTQIFLPLLLVCNKLFLFPASAPVTKLNRMTTSKRIRLSTNSLTTLQGGNNDEALRQKRCKLHSNPCVFIQLTVYLRRWARDAIASQTGDITIDFSCIFNAKTVQTCTLNKAIDRAVPPDASPLTRA